VRCIDRPLRPLGRRARGAVGLGLLALAACNSPLPPDPSRPVAAVAPAPPAPAPATSAPRPLPPAQTSDDYKLRIARRLVAANPAITYLTPAPDPLLAIPILEIEVNADGSLRNISVLRRPSDDEAQDTVQTAIEAVRRAAPFGDVSHVPRPWKFTQIFLFDDNRRFKPQLLD
jgi:TonB family protein